MRSDERGDGWKHDWASRRAEEGQDGLPDCNLISNSFQEEFGETRKTTNNDKVVNIATHFDCYKLFSVYGT